MHQKKIEVLTNDCALSLLWN